MSSSVMVSLDETTLAALDELAERTDRSRSSLVAEAVHDFVALNEWQRAKIEAGIAAAHAGDFVSDGELARVRDKFRPQG